MVDEDYTDIGSRVDESRSVLNTYSVEHQTIKLDQCS